MTGLVNLFYWALDNKAELLADISGIIGAASVLVAAVTKLVDLLVAIFPKLKGADGKLHWAVGWLSGIAQSPWLNAVALNRKPWPVITIPTIPPMLGKTVALMFLLGAVALPAPARAQALISAGPTLPLIEVRPQNPHPVSLAAGAGAFRST